MATLPAAYVTAASNVRIIRPWLVHLAFAVGDAFWTDFSQAVYFEGNRYVPKPLRVSGISSRQGETDSTAELQVGDAGGLASAYVLAASSPQGTVVTIREGILDGQTRSTACTTAVVRFHGRIVNARTERRGVEMVGRFVLGPYLDGRYVGVPRRDCSATCAFVRDFKGLLCGATGAATTCGGTISDCSQTDKVSPPAAGGNRTRFGGFLGLPPDGYLVTWGDGSRTVQTAPKKTESY